MRAVCEDVAVRFGGQAAGQGFARLGQDWAVSVVVEGGEVGDDVLPATVVVYGTSGVDCSARSCQS
jgi:hypothetical protein